MARIRILRGLNMARVTGIGGVFLRSKDPKAMAKWYAEHLGVTLSDYGGVTFEWKDEVPAGTGATAWSAFPQDTKYFGDSGQSAMIDYRVDDLDALLADLAAKGVWIDPKREDADYGRFAWIKDCDGNRVELWQPLAN
jgi:predicted enzyme related to lactoylglutathione lyase